MKLQHRSTNHLKSGVTASRALSRRQSGSPGVKFKDIQLWMTVALFGTCAFIFSGSWIGFGIAVWSILRSVTALWGIATAFAALNSFDCCCYP
jgi:hypothetical protein